MMSGGGEGPDANGVELVAYETGFHDTFFDFLSKSKEMHVTWVPFIPTTHQLHTEIHLHTKIRIRCQGDGDLEIPT